MNALSFSIVSLCVVLMSCYSSVSLHAQYKDIVNYEHLTVADGLADRIIHDVFIDDFGYHYIHTASALHKIFQQEMVEILKFNSFNDIYQLLEREDHFLRVDINHCVQIIKKSDLSLQKNICLSSIIADSIRQVDTHNNRLNIWTNQKNGILVYEIDHINTELQIIDTYQVNSPNEILATARGEESTFWINDQDQLYKDDVLLFEPETKWNKIPHPPQIKTINNAVYFSFVHHEGIFKYQDGRVDTIMADEFIEFAQVDQKQTIAIGVTSPIGMRLSNLLIITPDDSVHTWVEIIEENNRVKNIASTDYSKEVMLATYNGLYGYTMAPKGLQSRFSRDAGSSGFGNIIRSLAIDKDDNIKMVQAASPSIFTIDGDSIFPNIDIFKMIGNHIIWIEHEPSTNIYWLAQYLEDGTSNIFAYNYWNKTVQSYSVPVIIDKIHVLDTVVWATGRKLSGDGGVFTVHKKSGAVKEYFQDLLEGKMVRASFFEEDQYYFGTIAGLVVYDPSTGSVNDTVLIKTEDLYVSNIELLQGHIFVGTYGKGLFIYNDCFQLIAHTDIGVTTPSNTVAAIEQDDQGRLWVSSYAGLSILDKDYKVMDYIDVTECSAATEFNRDASIKHEGLLHFGAVNGIVTIDPNAYFSQDNQRKILLTKVRYQERNQSVTLKQDYGKVNIYGQPDELVLYFHSPAFMERRTNPKLETKRINIIPNPENVVFKSNSITISQPQYDKYSIAYIDKISNTEQIIGSIEIYEDRSEILKASGVGLLISFFAILGAMYFVQSNNRSNVEKMKLNEELSNAKMKALRSQLNPHFIFNALNSIQYFIQVNDKISARDYLSKFAKLMRLSLESSYNNEVPIMQEIEQLTLYLELEKLRFEEKWNYNIHVDPNIILDNRSVPSMIIQPIVENAIIHGLAHRSNIPGLLELSFEEFDDSIVITVEDNGIGREASTKINRNSLGSHHISRSTSITKQRIDLFNQNDYNRIKIRHKDIIDSNNIAKGTKVTITLIKQNYAITQSSHTR